MNEQQYENQMQDGRLIRQLGHDDQIDLERDDQFNIDQRKIKDDILFAIQGFGSIQRLNRDGIHIDAYIKGKHCESSIKDLIRLLKNDDPNSPLARLTLARYSIVESDLINLLLTQMEDKKLSFWLIALMTLLTAAPSEGCSEDERKMLNEANRAYKRAFLRKECLHTLLVHFADYFQTPPEQRKNAHLQLVQFIILLLRNLLQITNAIDEDSFLHQHFLVNMMKESTFESLLFLAQSEETLLLKKVDMPLLEILYHTFTCFDPRSIYESHQPTQFKKLFRTLPVPTRHSRFMPYFASFISYRTSIKSMRPQIHINKRNLFKEQKPCSSIVSNVLMSKRMYFTDPTQLLLTMMEGDSETAKQRMCELSTEFVSVEFSRIVLLVFDSIYKEEPRVLDKHKIYYFMLCSWAVYMTRQKYQAARKEAKTPQQRCRVEFDLGQIAPLMQVQHFELIYKVLYHQVTKEKKKDFKVNNFHAALVLFEEYLKILSEMFVSLSMNDRKNANALMANMFRHDVARVLKQGFILSPSEEITRELIMVCHIFFKLLSEYAKGKILTVQTNRLVKRKKLTAKQKAKQKELEDFIEKDDDDEDDDGDYGGSQDPEARKKRKEEKRQHAKQLEEEDQEDDNPVFQQRKYNQQSEFSVIAEYTIINKYLTFLRGKRFLTNDPELNTAILTYFDKIGTMLKGNWLFYQADTLTIFSEILAQKEFVSKNHKLLKVMNDTSRSFIELLKKNRLALCQSLFRYSSLAVKENVLNNYEPPNQ